MTAPTPEERAELERILFPICESCESNSACKESGQCWLCAVLRSDAVLALIRERDYARFQMELWRGRFNESERLRLDPFQGRTDEKVTT